MASQLHRGSCMIMHSVAGTAPLSGHFPVDRHARTLQTIAVLFSVVFIVIGFTARVPTYRFAPVFLIPLLWGVYYFRRSLNLHPLHFALYGLAMLLHDVGAFGFYQHSPLPFSFDIAVHFYFGFVGALLVFRILEHYLALRGFWLWVGTLLVVMGLGAHHEIIEYASYLMLGEEKGMLKPSTSYFFDTQRDLLNNLLGCNLALLLYFITRRLASQRATSNE